MDRLQALKNIIFISALLLSSSLAQTDEPPKTVPDLPDYPHGLIPKTPIVVINELDINADGNSQFIELFDGGIGNVSLSDLAIVLLGNGGTVYNDPVPLDNQFTNQSGYYLLASSGYQGRRNKGIPDLQKDGINAVAVYNNTEAQLDHGDSVTTTGLLDAVVYGNASDVRNNILVTTLLPGKQPLQDASSTESLSRCRGWQGLMPQAFVTATRSPWQQNDCDLPNIFINEANVQNATSLDDWFIELYDGGVGNQPLDGIVMAFYHSQLDLSFLAVDLTNQRTDAAGLYVLGVQPNSLYDSSLYPYALPENQFLPYPEGIALHLSSPKRFEKLVPLTAYRLIDAIVYNNPKSHDLSVLHTLLPYQHRINEVLGPNNEDMSISRCACCTRLDATSFGEGPLTPAAINTDCILSNRSLSSSEHSYRQLVRINEVKLMNPDNPDKDGEYIELSSNGFGKVKLDGIVLVMFNERTVSYRTISLDGYLTSEAGYLVIGKAGLRPPPDVVVPEDGEPMISGAGAMTLYLGAASNFPDGSFPHLVDDPLLDSVVFGFAGNVNSLQRLLYYLTPNQAAIELQPSPDNVPPSILRCHSNQPSTQLAFVQGDPSPGVDNTCPLPPIVINELNIISSNGTAEFLEISSLGIPFFPLDKLSVILWRSLWGAIGGIGLYGWQTDEHGFFVIEQTRVVGSRPSFPVSLSNSIVLAPGAVSIHVSRPGNFPPGSQVSNQSLVDALVFGISKDDFIPQDMIDTLTPNRDWIHEDELVKYEDVSINRCARQNGQVEYILDNLSPNATNYCPRTSSTKITINEVHLTYPSQMYIELWDMGVGYTELDGLQMVLFEENGLFSKAIDLTGQTDSHGYFIVGHVTRPAVDITIPLRYSLRNGGAVAIYESSQSFNIGDVPTSVGLMSAVVHVMGGSYTDAAAANFQILTPESRPFLQADSSDLSSTRNALSRCFNSSLRVTAEAFSLRAKTQRSLNDCPTLSDDVYINEVEVTKPQSFIPFVKEEFIELYDGGRGNTTMKYLTLVLFDGGVPFFGGFSRDVAFYSLSLDGLKTNADGYFVIGSSRLNQSLVDYAVDTSITPFLQLGIVGIALYRAPVGAFPSGANATTTSLIDAMIYVTGRQEAQHSLVDKLLPGVVGSGMVIETGSWLEGHGSMSRCLGDEKLNPLVYILAEEETPRKANNCSSITPNFTTAIVISEVNLDRDSFFVELYDFGAGNTSLDTLLLVVYGSSLVGGTEEPRNIQVIDLHGERTNAEGYFVVGTDRSFDKQIGTSFRDVATGVGLYHGQVTHFPGGSLPTTQNLIDAVVVNESRSNPLARQLLPGQSGVADGDVEGLQRSVSRCFGRKPLDMFAFLPSMPTPGSRNNCSRQPVVINEINTNHETISGTYQQEFIELYDGGIGHTPLTGIVVVIYNGDRHNFANWVIALNNTQTNANGYFVIGKSNRNFTVDLEVNTFGQLIVDNGAVALYHDDSRNYRTGMLPTNTRLQDAVVYGPDFRDSQLIEVLIPGQMQLIEDQGFLDGDESIVRCDCCQALNMSVYELSYPTPGRFNPCVPLTTTTTPTTRPPLTPPSSSEVYINEIAMKTHFFTKEYIELKGKPSLSLENYFIVLYDIQGVAYFTMQLGKTIGPDGFFLIGSPNMSPPPHLSFPNLLGNYIEEKGGAVALYYGYKSDVAKDSEATEKHLIDALVYTAIKDMPVGGGIDILTMDSEQLYADLEREESISRCYWQSLRNNEDFTQTDRTPGNQNDCPSSDYQRTLQMKLTDADYTQWHNNPGLLMSLRQMIIDGVNERCKCGFNHHYIAAEVLLKGSVVYQADILAFNNNQSSLIYTSFAEFVTDSQTLVIDGQSYQVDKCVEDCVVAPTPTVSGGISMPTVVLSTTTSGLNGTKEKRSDDNTGAAVGVTLGLIILIVLVVTVLVILIRKRIICYTKDTRLTEEGPGVEYSVKPEGFDTVEFQNNTYEPQY